MVTDCSISGALLDSLKDPKYSHVFLAAWQRPSYISILQTPYAKLTVVEGAGMSPGAKFLSLPIRTVELSGIFQGACEEDYVLKLLMLSKHNQTLDAVPMILDPVRVPFR
jgi:hypothetical protein